MKSIIATAKASQRIFAKYSQEQTDKIFRVAAMAAFDHAQELATAAAIETKMGNPNDKYHKNVFASKIIYESFANTKTVGVIEDDKTSGIRKSAYPVGLIAAIVPCTNPTSTAIYKALLALKTRNAIIISPHPRAKNSTNAAIDIIHQAAWEAGAPWGLVSCLPDPTIDNTKTLIQHHDMDLVLATGGNAMVRSAYSSGHPAIGVGSGNTPVIIDDSANIYSAVKDIVTSKTFDNGLLCPSEQVTIVVDSVYDAVMEQFYQYDIHIANNQEIDKLRAILFDKRGNLNPAVVGQYPHQIGKLAGFHVHESARLILAPIQNLMIDKKEPMSLEKLSPILTITRVPDFVTAVRHARTVVECGGMGHTAALHTNRNNHPNIQLFESSIPTCRLLVNQPSTQGALGYHYNRHWPPSLMMGCGTWGGNSICGNILPQHLLNINTTVYRDDMVI
jgi:acetaldehyde dehydrogenase / alcohol dehydrogenase